jgi:2-polyprenyl-3-methyl-5-hydroxy-6-metoxy-1,4-benzoquinol methylase
MRELAERFVELGNRWIFFRPRQMIVELVKGQRVLDVCCGGGDLSAQLVAAGCQVVGVDSSSRTVYTLIKRDERGFLKSDPEHYQNFQEFMQNGGLRGWVLARKESIERQQDYWGGTVELVVCR